MITHRSLALTTLCALAFAGAASAAGARVGVDGAAWRQAAPDRLEQPVAEVLAPLVAVAGELAEIEALTGRAEPSVVT